jgi:hypothetical protein
MHAGVCPLVEVSEKNPAPSDPLAVPGVFLASGLAKPKFDKTTYQRAYMKAWRAKWRKPE